MEIRELIQGLAERIAASASVKVVYGDPVAVGERTVIPAAVVKYGFGGGGGRSKADAAPGGGGGGRVSVRPCGALEITPQRTRFVEFGNGRATAIALAAGFLIGAAVMGARRPRRIELVKPPR